MEILNVSGARTERKTPATLQCGSMGPIGAAGVAGLDLKEVIANSAITGARSTGHIRAGMASDAAKRRP